MYVYIYICKWKSNKMMEDKNDNYIGTWNKAWPFHSFPCFSIDCNPFEHFWWFHELLGTSTMDVAAPDAGHDSASVGQSLRSKRSVLGGNFGIWIRSQAARETQISGADDLQVAQEQVQHYLQFFGRRGNAYCRYYLWFFVYPMRAPFSTATWKVRFHKMNCEGSQLFVAQSGDGSITGATNAIAPTASATKQIFPVWMVTHYASYLLATKHSNWTSYLNWILTENSL